MHDLDQRRVSRGVANGQLVRLKRGAFFELRAWQAMSAAEQHRERVRAFAITSRSAVFSHWSAASILELPIVGRWPVEVHVSADRATGGRSEPGLIRHCVGLPDEDVVVTSGIATTSVARTLVDLAAAQPFRFAVAPVDHGLRVHLVGRDELVAAADVRQRGRLRALRVIEFGDARSANAGESLSRAVIHQFGFPRPELQVEHQIDGRTYYTDFEWPEHRAIAEFDGKGKYLSPELTGSRSPAQVVLDEKDRENRIRRSTGYLVGRWDWHEALRREPVALALDAIGLPRGARARST